ncbi:hypothetical protein [Robertmurraya massiliosenegalensis]|uniref:hypothetical protein n=1 Tax=Robertmurraya massiliosenegalensis TaxID=1287657 RepID=UPI0002F46408|nr:hypothetical protein [Robertmurraya massiliosenegalensis]
MRKKLTWIGAGVVVMSAIFIYSFFLSKPTPFPASEVLIEELNQFFPEANAEEIQDSIQIDERHTFVPFISETGDYGLSYWVWKKRSWNVDRIDTKGGPMVWEINSRKPSSYYFVWNLSPNNFLDSMDFYMIRDRGYQVIDGKETYYPRVQLETNVSLQEKTYGVLQLPEDWAAVRESFIKMGSAQETDLDLLFNQMFPDPYLSFGWRAYDRLGNESFPEETNGNSFSNGKLTIDYVMILNGEELEQP